MSVESPIAETKKMPRIKISPGGALALKKYEKEIATYVRELPRLLEEREAGRYVILKGDEVDSVWDTYRDANQARYAKFGLDDESSCITRVDSRDVERYAILMAQIAESKCQSSNGEF